MFLLSKYLKNYTIKLGEVMKKIMILISILIVIYIALIIGYRFYGPGHNYQYVLNTGQNEFQIDETFINDKTNSNYYFQIGIKDTKFYYRSFETFRNQSKVIQDIYYYESDKYQCILPVFLNDKVISDILCHTANGYSYFYYSLKGMDKDLDAFAASLSEYGYHVDNWFDTTNSFDKDGIKVYTGNILSNHHIAMTDYKGILLTSHKEKSIYHISLFENDVYQKKLSTIIGNKYVVANYNEKFRFHDFYIIDITTGTKTTFASQQELSFDSYVQGVYENSMYIFDRSSKKQYEVNIKDKEVREVGNETNGVKIYNGTEWQQISTVTAAKENIYFTVSPEESTDSRFVKVQKYGNEEYGYYFYYKQVDNKFLVYRSDINNLEQLTYLFTTTNMDNIVFYNDFIYYTDEEYIKKYSDKYGIQNIIQYSELKFNDHLIFGVYVD